MLDDLVVHQQSVGDRVGCYLPPGISQKDTEQWLKDNYPEWLPQLYRTHLVSFLELVILSSDRQLL